MPARSSQPTDPAIRVWTAMYEFVAAQDRRKLVNLTAPGREAAARGQQLHTEPPAALAALRPEDLAQLEELMSRLDRMPPSPPASPDRRDVPERQPTPTLTKTRKS